MFNLFFGPTGLPLSVVFAAVALGVVAALVVVSTLKAQREAYYAKIAEKRRWQSLYLEEFRRRKQVEEENHKLMSPAQATMV